MLTLLREHLSSTPQDEDHALPSSPPHKTTTTKMKSPLCHDDDDDDEQMTVATDPLDITSCSHTMTTNASFFDISQRSLHLLGNSSFSSVNGTTSVNACATTTTTSMSKTPENSRRCSFCPEDSASDWEIEEAGLAYLDLSIRSSNIEPLGTTTASVVEEDEEDEEALDTVAALALALSAEYEEYTTTTRRQQRRRRFKNNNNNNNKGLLQHEEYSSFIADFLQRRVNTFTRNMETIALIMMGK